MNRIRKPNLDDLDSIKNILLQWTELEEAEKYCQRIQSEIEGNVDFNNHFWVYVLDRNIIGVGGLADPLPKVLVFTKRTNPIEIKILYFDNQYRGKGFGTEMVRFLENEAIKYGNNEILIRSADQFQVTAWGFYLKMGYQQVGMVDDSMGVFIKEIFK